MTEQRTDQMQGLEREHIGTGHTIDETRRLLGPKPGHIRFRDVGMTLSCLKYSIQSRYECRFSCFRAICFQLFFYGDSGLGLSKNF